MQLQMFVKGQLITNAQSDTRNNENDDLISYLIKRGALGYTRNRKTEENFIQNRKQNRPEPKTVYKTYYFLA